MANTLRFKRGLVSGIPTAALGEPLFTTDTFDLYIGNGTGNTRFQKYIASGTTSQLLRGDGSLLTMPIVLTSPSNGQVLKFNGTSWVNDSDAGITGSGAAGQVAYFTGATTQGGSNNLFWDATNSRLGIGTNAPTQRVDISGYIRATSGYVGNNGLLLWADNSSIAAGARLFSTGNFGINTGTTDNGARLQVSGTSTFSDSVGIGTSADLTFTTLRINKIISGSSTSYSILNGGQIQSTVSVAYYNRTLATTQATTFTLNALVHYAANQSTFGAGSTVTNQYGYIADPTLIGATNNYGFYGEIPSGTGRWNLYMNGTAANYLAGSLGIGTNAPTRNLDVLGTARVYGNLLLQSNFNSDISLNLLQTGKVDWFFTNRGATGNLVIGNGNGDLATFSTSGNLGLGVTPSAWGAFSSIKALQINDASFWSLNLTGYSSIGGNYYYDGSFRYIKAAQATDYYQYQGTHAWRTAASGTAGNAISFTQAMTLYATGNLAIGSTTDGGQRLQVTGTSNFTGAATFGALVTVNNSITTSLNQNATTYVAVTNTDIGVNTKAEFQAFSRNGGTTRFGRNSNLTTAYKMLNASDGYVLNETLGDFAIFNDNATGSIKMAAGGSSTPHFTIASTGAATFSSSLVSSTLGVNVSTIRTRSEISSTLSAPTALNTDINAGNLLLSDGGNIGMVFGLYPTTFDSYIQARNNLGSNNVAYNLILNPLGGNVGIGLTPLYKLDVSGSARVSDAIAIGTTPDTNLPFKILKNLNSTVGIRFENTSTSSLAFSAIQLGTDVTGGTKFTNLVYASSGVTASGVYNPDGTSLINNGTGGLNFLGNPIRMYTGGSNGVLRWDMNNDGVITNYNAFAAPTSSVTDSFRLYSADVTAGNAAPHFRTENGAVIKLYQETTGVGNAIFSQGGGNSVLDDSTFDGYTLRQIVKALRNQGILA